MKRTLFATGTLVFLLAGLVAAQSADEDYLKAMQLSDNCAKVQALEAYIAKYAGQGTTYENWAYFYYCLTPCTTKNALKAAEYGEKALGMSGIDEQTKIGLLGTIPRHYQSAGQMDKAKAAALKLIEYGKTLQDKALGTRLQAGGYQFIGGLSEKAGDFGTAAENYITAYGILKDPSIFKQLKTLADTLYKGQKYAEAEKVFRQFYAADKGPESASLLGQTLYKQNKIDEALAIYREAYAKKKTGGLAQNIAVILNAKVKTDPSKTNEAISANIEAALLNPAQQKNFLGAAQNLFVGQDKDLASSYTQIEDHNKAIEEFTKTYNAKADGKTEDDLSDADKKVLKKLEDNIEVEKQAIARIQSSQKGVLDKFNTLVAQAKTRLGK